MISVRNLRKAYGDQVVFDGAGFQMTAGERLGLVGRNGSGKTTLFRILTGAESADDGEIVVPKAYRVGHLSQHLRFERSSILEEACRGLGASAEEQCHRAEAALMGLGFREQDLARPASAFSGGFQVRVELARVLVARPELLLLDEPTNYLDIVSVRWLERLLDGWRGELIVITHDRRFLERVTTHTMAVHRRTLRRMPGSVGKLYGQIACEEEVHERARRNEAKRRSRDERFIERFRAKNTKASAVQSRIRALEKRGRLQAPESEPDLRFRFTPAPFHATTMLTASDLAFGFPGGPLLIDGLDLDVERGDRIALIGPNGRGKTTLLDLLAGERQPVRGRVKANPNTRSAYFGQMNVDRLDPGRTVEEELLAVRPEQGLSAVRGLAGLLMFPGEAALKQVAVLSGGERSRVLLGRILAEPANLLLLDEPSNHLDLQSIDGLLDALDGFPGAVLLVTHDERILERVATRLVVFDGGRVTLFEGGYRDFLERVGWRGEAEAQDGAQAASPRAGADPRALRRRRAELVNQRAHATRPLRRRVEALEERIDRLERDVAALDETMAARASAGRPANLAQPARDAKRKREEIEACFDELEAAADALARAERDWDARLGALG
jgi:ATP-binding cassette subfamily F protein 3